VTDGNVEYTFFFYKNKKDRLCLVNRPIADSVLESCVDLSLGFHTTELVALEFPLHLAQEFAETEGSKLTVGGWKSFLDFSAFYAMMLYKLRKKNPYFLQENEEILFEPAKLGVAL
jgi:hypothetical protein